MADELAEIEPRKRGICVDLTLIPLYTNSPATCDKHIEIYGVHGHCLCHCVGGCQCSGYSYFVAGTLDGAETSLTK